jgi:hypothetical protein
VDPDPDLYPDSDWIRIKRSPCIRMHNPDPDRIQEGKKCSKKVNKLIFLRAGCSVLRVEGFSCSLDVLYEGLGISKLLLLIKKRYLKKFKLYFFLQFLVIETLDTDPYPDPDSLEMLVPDPQHCLWDT